MLTGNRFSGFKRSNYCGDFSAADCGKKVALCGWVQAYRNLGGILFIRLRDRSGIIQLHFGEKTDEKVFADATTLRAEDVIAITGTVALRAEKDINPDIPFGDIEIEVDTLRILSKSQTPPFDIVENSNVSEDLRLKYRYLDLRRPDMQYNIIMRHRITKITQDYYDKKGFLTIETPMMIKSTPEGARDYLVPSRVHPGKFYALAQSPQLYKQLLMLAGYDRYMQIARCFRDEDLRADRQPEFTQIDLEMSFVSMDEVLEINEGFIKYLFKNLLDIDIPTPFLRLTYKEAMDRFGSDKPDTRFGFELKDISSAVANSEFKVFSGVVASGGTVRAINAKGCAASLPRREIDGLADFVKTYRAKGLAWMKETDEGMTSSFAKFLSAEEIENIKKLTDFENGDVLFVVADANPMVVYNSLGALRCELAKRLDMIDKKQFNFLWVTEFPMFEYSETEDRLTAMHHPFTAPMDADIALLETEPQKVRADAYDMVLNGSELGGGSLRIYDAELQAKIFNILGFTDEEANERFGFLLNAFKYGVPPHGGMAFGLDRLVMLITGCDSLRGVIPFPKVQNASELMTECPSFVDDKQLAELSIAVSKNEEE